MIGNEINITPVQSRLSLNSINNMTPAPVSSDTKVLPGVNQPAVIVEADSPVADSLILMSGAYDHFVPNQNNAPQTPVSPAEYTEASQSFAQPQINMSQILQLFLPALTVEYESAATQAELAGKVIDGANKYSSLYAQLTDAMTQIMQNNTDKMTESNQKHTTISGVVAFFEAIIEVVVAVAMMGSAAGTAVGVAMLADAAARIGGAVKEINNPQLSQNSKAAKYANNGIFAVFGQGAQAAQAASMLIMTVLTCGATLATNISAVTRETITKLIKPVLTSAYQLINAGVTTYGAIKSSVDSTNNNSQDPEQAMIDSAASMGLAALVTQGLITPIKNNVADNRGDTAASRMDMISLLIASGGAAVMNFGLARNNIPVSEEQMSARARKFSQIMTQVTSALPVFFTFNNLTLSVANEENSVYNYQDTKITTQNDLEQKIIKNLQELANMAMESIQQLGQSYQQSADKIVSASAATTSSLTQAIKSIASQKQV